MVTEKIWDTIKGVSAMSVIVLCVLWGISKPHYESNDDVVDDEADRPNREFYGNKCKDDCSGHEAGYQWAEENDIDDEDNCNGNSESFNEGCVSYVAESAGSADNQNNDDIDTASDESND